MLQETQKKLELKSMIISASNVTMDGNNGHMTEFSD